jgi:peptide/nickel transport system permease protein
MPEIAPNVLALTPAAASADAPGVETSATKKLGIMGYLALGWVSLMLFVAVFIPWLPVDDPNKLFPLKRGLHVDGPGTAGHLLGGDNVGRDLFARVLWGSRTSLLLGVASVAVGFLIGGALGLIAGYFRGRLDSFLSGIFDTLLAIPAIVMALALVAVFAPSDSLNPVSDTQRMVVLIIALGVVSIPLLARITRASTLTWSQRDFVLAARALGAKNRRIMFREVLPNVLPAMFSIFLLAIAVIIVAEGGLSILGVGVQLPTASWGNILAEGYPNLRITPWPILAPSIVIFLTVLSLNYLGDVVRARFDVRDSAL